MNTVADIEREVLSLPEDQRFSLIKSILDHSETESDADIDDFWQREIQRRIEKVDSGESKTHSAASVFSELEREFAA